MYEYPGYETGQAWTLEPGNLEGGSWGNIKEYWWLRPQNQLAGPPEFPLRVPRFLQATAKLYRPIAVVASGVARHHSRQDGGLMGRASSA